MKAEVTERGHGLWALAQNRTTACLQADIHLLLDSLSHLLAHSPESEQNLQELLGS